MFLSCEKNLTAIEDEDAAKNDIEHDGYMESPAVGSLLIDSDAGCGKRAVRRQATQAYQSVDAMVQSACEDPGVWRSEVAASNCKVAEDKTMKLNDYAPLPPPLPPAALHPTSSEEPSFSSYGASASGTYPFHGRFPFHEGRAAGGVVAPLTASNVSELVRATSNPGSSLIGSLVGSAAAPADHLYDGSLRRLPPTTPVPAPERAMRRADSGGGVQSECRSPAISLYSSANSDAANLGEDSEGNGVHPVGGSTAARVNGGNSEGTPRSVRLFVRTHRHCAEDDSGEDSLENDDIDNEESNDEDAAAAADVVHLPAAQTRLPLPMDDSELYSEVGDSLRGDGSGRRDDKQLNCQGHEADFDQEKGVWTASAAIAASQARKHLDFRGKKAEGDEGWAAAPARLAAALKSLMERGMQAGVEIARIAGANMETETGGGKDLGGAGGSEPATFEDFVKWRTVANLAWYFRPAVHMAALTIVLVTSVLKV